MLCGNSLEIGLLCLGLVLFCSHGSCLCSHYAHAYDIITTEAEKDTVLRFALRACVWRFAFRFVYTLRLRLRFAFRVSLCACILRFAFRFALCVLAGNKMSLINKNELYSYERCYFFE